MIIQENRSFSNFFAGYPGAQDAPMYGYQYNPMTKQRVKIPLQPHNFLGPDFDHTWLPAITDYDKGMMDGYPTANLRLHAASRWSSRSGRWQASTS